MCSLYHILYACWRWRIGFLFVLICVFIHFIIAVVQHLIMLHTPPDCFLVQRPLSSLWPVLWFSSSVTAWSEKKKISAANIPLWVIVRPPTPVLQWLPSSSAAKEPLSLTKWTVLQILKLRSPHCMWRNSLDWAPQNCCRFVD